jgi:hypothetical protein
MQVKARSCLRGSDSKPDSTRRQEGKLDEIHEVHEVARGRIDQR